MMKAINTQRIQFTILLILLIGIITGCNISNNHRREILLSAKVPEIDKTREAKIVTAFFGLDNGLTQRARALYRNAPSIASE